MGRARKSNALDRSDSNRVAKNRRRDRKIGIGGAVTCSSLPHHPIWLRGPFARPPNAHASDPVLVHWARGFCSTLPSGPRLAATPLRLRYLHLYQVVNGTFTSTLVEHARRTKKTGWHFRGQPAIAIWLPFG